MAQQPSTKQMNVSLLLNCEGNLRNMSSYISARTVTPCVKLVFIRNIHSNMLHSPKFFFLLWIEDVVFVFSGWAGALCWRFLNLVFCQLFLPFITCLILPEHRSCRFEKYPMWLHSCSVEGIEDRVLLCILKVRWLWTNRKAISYRRRIPKKKLILTSLV